MNNEMKFQEAYRVAATIVGELGEKYLPIFTRMHEELIEQQKRMDLIQIAKSVV